MFGTNTLVVIAKSLVKVIKNASFDLNISASPVINVLVSDTSIIQGEIINLQVTLTDIYNIPLFGAEVILIIDSKNYTMEESSINQSNIIFDSFLTLYFLYLSIEIYLSLKTKVYFV